MMGWHPVEWKKGRYRVVMIGKKYFSQVERREVIYDLKDGICDSLEEAMEVCDKDDENGYPKKDSSAGD